MIVQHTLRPGNPGRTPLVLLHAFPVDARMWSGLAPLVSDGTPVLAFDLPGMGAAGLPDARTDATPSVEAAADAVAAALPGPAVIAGLSMGGYVTLALAERHPQLVAGLALLDTKAVADTDEAAAHRRRIADEAERTGSVDPVRGMARSLLGATTLAERPALVDVVTGWIDDQAPAGIAWSQRAMAARPDRTAVLRGWTAPALVLVGAEDGPTPPEQAELMAAELGVTAVVVPAAGHLTAVEQPEAVAGALNDLLARL
ncbi:alpha/beta hydrolase [Cellulomonas sp. RIT-PI-Y]|uniref:alpha/beta fold hydrolase n=1 Tax=Cellulomonas sp. RIT-PI-Y TaxID=3035297 RepID=UPI0021DA9AF5|nr:alpha/beta hydrolase [Cellulomonas sp. RIT-PI-Y]